MTKRARPIAVLLATLTVAAGVGCGPQRIRTSPPPGQTLVLLLPDESDATVGRAVVSSQAAQVELAAAHESTSVSPNQPPAPATIMSEADASRLFDDVLSILPPAPRHFTLYFRFESDELTAESRALLPQILQAVGARPFPEVGVVGHTDTTGTPTGNFELGLRRANAIRDRLRDAGIEVQALLAF